MYMREGEPVVRREPWVNFTAVAAAVGILVLSVSPGPLFDWASQALLRLF